MHVRERPEPQPRAALVVLAPPLLEPARDQPVGLAPQRPPGAGARQPRPDRVRREARRQVRMHVWDERRHRHALELGGQRRRGREDVRHHHVRRERPHDRPRLGRRPHRSRVRLQRLLLRRETPGTRARPRTSSRQPRRAPASAARSAARRRARAPRAPRRGRASGTRAPDRRRRRGGPSSRELGDEPELLQAILERPRHRRDHQRADPGVAEHREPLAHVVGRPAQRDRVD